MMFSTISLFQVAILLVLLFLLSTSTHQSKSPHLFVEGTRTFERFFATTPIPDEWLAGGLNSHWIVPLTSTSRQWLQLLPTFHTQLEPSCVSHNISTPTSISKNGVGNEMNRNKKKRNNQQNKEDEEDEEEEILCMPFVDEVVAVRILGGWDAKYGRCNSSCDIVFRNETSGNLQFRWNLLDARLDPYLAVLQKRVLLVLDNVPYCLVQKPILGPFGQDAPPSNMTEWHFFVTNLMTHIKERYQQQKKLDLSSRLRVRVGTEPNGPRYGNVQEYSSAYITAARAVKQVFPSVAVTAGNWEHMFKKNGPSAFAEQFYKNVASASSSHGGSGSGFPSLVDLIGQSDYVGAQTEGKRYPCILGQGVQQMRSYAQIYHQEQQKQQQQEQEKGKATIKSLITDFEVMEWGTLNNVFKRPSTEPGSFGASLFVASWTNALSIGASRIYHWGAPFDRARGQAAYLFESLGWAMSMADLLSGLEISGFDMPSSSKAFFPGSCSRGAYAMRGGNNVTLVTAFDQTRGATFRLSYTVKHNVRFFYKLDSKTSPFDVITREATALNFTQYGDKLPYSLSHLLNEQGQKWISKDSNWMRFLTLQNKTFTKQEINLKEGETLEMEQFETYLLAG